MYEMRQTPPYAYMSANACIYIYIYFFSTIIIVILITIINKIINGDNSSVDIIIGIAQLF